MLNYATQTRANPAGITEILMANSGPSNQLMIMPMLAHLSQQTKDRWFTWIAPKGGSKKNFDGFGFDKQRVRLIHTRNDEETLWVLWEALRNGTSAAVAANLSSLGDKDRANLETAARIGGTRGLVLRYRA
ncbi:MAG: cell division inhibitor SulA [Lentisphaeria bacterium]|jgi:cell division inhibitor SulA